MAASVQYRTVVRRCPCDSAHKHRISIQLLSHRPSADSHTHSFGLLSNLASASFSTNKPVIRNTASDSRSNQASVILASAKNPVQGCQYSATATVATVFSTIGLLVTRQSRDHDDKIMATALPPTRRTITKTATATANTITTASSHGRRRLNW